MTKFKVIPVLDILNCEVVHAVKGERNCYKPLESKLFDSSDPLEILKVLSQKYHFHEFYIADLDAILNKRPNMALLNKILKITGIKIIIDPGIIDSTDVLVYSKLGIEKLIIGLETVKSLKEVQRALSIMGKEKLIISIDMYKGKLLSGVKGIKSRTPLDIVKKLQMMGINEIILLDLFRVGQKLGGIPSIFLEIRNIFNGHTYVGGGIKDYDDISGFIQQNFRGILIATAIYDGTINIQKLRKISN